MLDALGKKAIGLRLNHFPEQSSALALRNRFKPFLNAAFKPLDGPVQSKFPHGAGPVERHINTGGLANDIGVGNDILNVISDLVSFTDTFSQLAPQSGIYPRGGGAGGRRGDKQRPCLGSMIMLQIDPRFAFPGLPSTNTSGPPTPWATMPVTAASRTG